MEALQKLLTSFLGDDIFKMQSKLGENNVGSMGPEPEPALVHEGI